jgi:hypothetical protein
MGNGHGYASIQQGAVKRLWDVKQEETEVMWLLAEKLKAKGFPNLFDYYSKEFKDPETGKAPTTALEFSEIAAKMTSAPIWMAKEPLKGDAPINGWADFRKAKGMFSGPKYTLKKGWGGKFATATKKFEFYSETLKKGLLEHAKKHETTPDDILAVSGYVARGEVAFVPHYETPKRHGSVGDYPFTFIDYKSPPEPRGPQRQPALVPGVQEGRSRRCVLDRRGQDEPGRRRQAGPQEWRHGQDHFGGRHDHVRAQAVGGRAPRHRGQVLRPGPLGLWPRGGQRLCAKPFPGVATTTRSWSMTTTG